MLPKVGVEHAVSETAGVGGAVRSSDCEDSGVLAPPPPVASSPSFFLLLFLFGLLSGMMSEYSWMREAGPPEEEQGKEVARGVEGEEEEESCPNRCPCPAGWEEGIPAAPIPAGCACPGAEGPVRPGSLGLVWRLEGATFMGGSPVGTGGAPGSRGLAVKPWRRPACRGKVTAIWLWC